MPFASSLRYRLSFHDTKLIADLADRTSGQQVASAVTKMES
jgi:hypothetical protein